MSGASGAGVSGAAALSGLRSGSPGATAAFSTCVLVLAGALDLAAARTGCSAGERWVFASASAGGRRATETSNGKMCARMRFISSIGYRLRSCEKQVRTSPEPGSRDEDGSIICLN